MPTGSSRLRPATTRAIRLLVLIALCGSVLLPGRVQAGPAHPDVLRLIGQPDRLRAYWHDQRWNAEDSYACALYAQASVMEVFGYPFANSLANARELGLRDHWFDPNKGTIGLGQPFRAWSIPFEVYGSPIRPPIAPERALLRLELELLAGHFPIVNVDAWQLSVYRGSAVRWHTLWITGVRLDAAGRPTAVIANDSLRGAAVEYPPGEFLAAWGSDAFNFYAIFVHAPDEPHDPT